MRYYTSLTLTLLLCFGAAKVDADQTLTDLHLPITPRTAQEASRIADITRPTTDFSAPEQYETNQGGAATVRPRDTAHAFSQASSNISFEKELDFKVGNGLFKKLWVSSPSSTLASDGLGPLYNARSCQRCHLKDGRGHPPEGPNDTAVSMLLRVSIPGGTTPEAISDYLATRPDPVYGEQIQDFSVAGHASEGQIDITYTEIEVALSDGETARLRQTLLCDQRTGIRTASPRCDGVTAHCAADDRSGGCWMQYRSQIFWRAQTRMMQMVTGCRVARRSSCPVRTACRCWGALDSRPVNPPSESNPQRRFWAISAFPRRCSHPDTVNAQRRSAHAVPRRMATRPRMTTLKSATKGWRLLPFMPPTSVFPRAGMWMTPRFCAANRCSTTLGASPATPLNSSRIASKANPNRVFN